MSYEVEFIARVKVTNGGVNPTIACILAKEHLDKMIKTGKFTSADFELVQVKHPQDELIAERNADGRHPIG